MVHQSKPEIKTSGAAAALHGYAHDNNTSIEIHGTVEWELHKTEHL